MILVSKHSFFIQMRSFLSKPIIIISIAPYKEIPNSARHIMINLKDAQSSSQNLPLQFQYAIFHPILPQSVSQLLHDPKMTDVLKKDTWYVIQKKFTQNSWNSIFPFIVSAYCRWLCLYKNQYPNIIMSISKTNFTELNLLSLWGNNIASIEQLQFVNMPLLKVLCLNTNNITKTSTLNKGKWNQLKMLSLLSNPIDEIDITRLLMSEKEWGNDDECVGVGEQNRGHNWISVAAKMNFNNVTLTQNNGIKPSQRMLEIFKQKGLKIVFYE